MAGSHEVITFLVGCVFWDTELRFKVMVIKWAFGTKTFWCFFGGFLENAVVWVSRQFWNKKNSHKAHCHIANHPYLPVIRSQHLCLQVGKLAGGFATARATNSDVFFDDRPKKQANKIQLMIYDIYIYTTHTRHNHKVNRTSRSICYNKNITSGIFVIWCVQKFEGLTQQTWNYGLTIYACLS